MNQQIAVRLPEEQVRFLDHLVASGEAQSRAELVGRAVARLQRQHQALHDLEVVRAQPHADDDVRALSAGARRSDLDA